MKILPLIAMGGFFGGGGHAAPGVKLVVSDSAAGGAAESFAAGDALKIVRTYAIPALPNDHLSGFRITAYFSCDFAAAGYVNYGAKITDHLGTDAGPFFVRSASFSDQTTGLGQSGASFILTFLQDPVNSNGAIIVAGINAQGAADDGVSALAHSSLGSFSSGVGFAIWAGDWTVPGTCSIIADASAATGGGGGFYEGSIVELLQ